MRNIFELTKREQRIVIVIVTILVAFAFVKHFWQSKPQAPAARASSAGGPTAAKSTSTPAASSAVHSEENADDPRD
jgi:hypothetical protein